MMTGSLSEAKSIPRTKLKNNQRDITVELLTSLPHLKSGVCVFAILMNWDSTDWMKRLVATHCSGILLLNHCGFDRNEEENQLLTSSVSIRVKSTAKSAS
jgi:hypothetical protein